MDLSEPAASVLTPLRASILVALAGADDGMTGRGLARAAETSVTTTARVLDKLVRTGLVYRVEVGSASLYRLNHAHLAADAVLSLATMRTRLIDMLKKVVRDFDTRPVTALLFGSAARGDGDEDSDIDLLLVRPDGTDFDDPEWERDVRRLTTLVQNWTGNTANVIDYDETDLRATLAKDIGFGRELRRDAIHLYGDRLPLVRVAARKAAGR